MQRSAGRDEQGRGGDADHDARDGVQHDGFADDGRISAVPPAPERIADHDHVLIARCFFACGESAAALRRCAEKREEVRRDEGAAQAFGFTIAGEIPLGGRQCGEGFESGVRLAPLEVVLDAHG